MQCQRKSLTIDIGAPVWDVIPDLGRRALYYSSHADALFKHAAPRALENEKSSLPSGAALYALLMQLNGIVPA